MLRLSIALALCLGFLWPPEAAMAQDIGKDIQVVGRALGFLESPPAGTVSLGIVFDPGNGASVEQAKALESTLSGGLKLGSLTLKPQLVEVGAVGQAGSVAALFVTTGMSGHYAPVSAAANAQTLLTIGADMDCVEGGHCVMGVAAVQESSEGISAITQLTNDVGSASDSLGSLTENLTGRAEELRSQVERFLQEVRAA